MIEVRLRQISGAENDEEQIHIRYMIKVSIHFGQDSNTAAQVKWVWWGGELPEVITSTARKIDPRRICHKPDGLVASPAIGPYCQVGCV